MSVKSWLTLGASLSLLAACATHQENPNYAYSTKYKAGAPTTTYASAPTSYTQSTSARYQSAASTTYASASIPASGEYTRIDQACLRKEKNHELIGAGLGGSIGAYAGKELIGGTKGTIIGAGLGGAAGYGIGDKTVNCDPQTFVMQSAQPAAATTYQPQTVQSSTVQSRIVTQESYAVPATHQYVSGDQSRIVYQSPRVEYQAPTDEQFADISDTGTPGYQVLQSQIIEDPAPIQKVATAASSAQLVDYDYSDNVISANAFTSPEYSETRVLGGLSTNHVVAEGDTVYSLARKKCVGVNDIKSLNNLDYKFSIKIGDRLSLPTSKC